MSGALLHSTLDYRLVALSVALAIFAAYTALDLAGRVTAARDWTRLLWLTGGASSMGLGIWAMHYIGMLAFSLPVPVLYHYPTVIVSLLAAIAASTVALYTVSRVRMGIAQQVIGSLIMGGGIAAMHYIGMAAMRLPAMMEYHWPRVALSVVLAVVISLVALILSFQAREEKGTSWRKAFSALGMGSAIPLMHYTGMWAVSFQASNVAPDASNAVGISELGAAAIGVVTFAVMGGAIVTSVLDRLLAAQRAVTVTAQESELYFHTLAEAVPEIIWTTDPAGVPDFFNSCWYRYTGLTVEQSRGADWKAVLHPDDLPACIEKWERSIATGEPYQIEYRFRHADGSYRWFLGRANAIRDEKGKVIKWFGTCTDIEDQKHNQQILENQIRDRTEELADANTRLQEEMWEKDEARRRLDEQNAGILRELTERSTRATMLAKMGELLQSCVNKDEVYAAALGFGPKIFPTSRGALALNPERKVAELNGSWLDCKLPLTVFEANSCWALRTGHPHLVVAGDTTAPCAHAAGVKNTYLCIPILAQGEALGILHFQATEEVPVLDDAELSLKTTFAGQIGLSVANIRLREALRNQSIKDSLTGLYNRRYLTEMLEREIRRAVRAEQSLGILMLDLDHFKKFNDTYGHEAGDTVLRETASFLTKSIRVEDVVCRFGGEEFVVILPTADLNAAHARAERIRSKLRELTVLHQGQSLGMITVSVGVATLPQHGTSPKDLLEAADAALYRAKREGRDRVVNAEPRPEPASESSPSGQTSPDLSAAK
jgi:diguanylate cyclase (GGDEF)-like protein/PAS domain S-box-containing protein